MIAEQKVILNTNDSEGNRVAGNHTLVNTITLLATTKVVVSTTIMVVISLGLTTTHHPVVTRITTTKDMWSLYF